MSYSFSQLIKLRLQCCTAQKDTKLGVRFRLVFFRKSNANTQYEKIIIREFIIKNSQNVAFLSAGAQCKVPTGESDYPTRTITREKKIIDGKNKKFFVADHDFRKLFPKVPMS